MPQLPQHSCHASCALVPLCGACCVQAVECGCVPQLLGLLQSKSRQLAAAAAAALMMLTLAKEGKVAVHQVRVFVCAGL